MYTFNFLKQLFIPKIQFGILGFSLGGGTESSNFSETSTQEIEKDETETQRQTGTTTTVGDTTQETTSRGTTTETATGLEESVLSLLDEETQGILSGLLSDLAGGDASGELLADLSDRALDAENTLTGLVDPIVANARANLEEGLGVTLQSLARSAGSGQNSLVQQLGLAEGAKVERQVADLAATLGFSVQEAVATQQQNALQTGVGATTALADILKGATQTGTVATEASTQAVQQLEELLTGTTREQQTINLTNVTDVDSLISAIETASGTGQTKGASAGLSIGI